MNLSDPRFEPIHEEFLPICVETVREIEARLNAALPREYVDFVTRYGGFAGDADVVFDDRRFPISTFHNDHKLVRNLDVYPDLAAESRFCFADDMMGNPYVLDALTGSVFFIDFTVNPPRGFKIAGSFEAFLASIEIQPFE